VKLYIIDLHYRHGETRTFVKMNDFFLQGDFFIAQRPGKTVYAPMAQVSYIEVTEYIEEGETQTLKGSKWTSTQ